MQVSSPPQDGISQSNSSGQPCSTAIPIPPTHHHHPLEQIPNHPLANTAATATPTAQVRQPLAALNLLPQLNRLDITRIPNSRKNSTPNGLTTINYSHQNHQLLPHHASHQFQPNQPNSRSSPKQSAAAMRYARAVSTTRSHNLNNTTTMNTNNVNNNNNSSNINCSNNYSSHTDDPFLKGRRSSHNYQPSSQQQESSSKQQQQQQQTPIVPPLFIPSVHADLAVHHSRMLSLSSRNHYNNNNNNNSKFEQSTSPIDAFVAQIPLTSRNNSSTMRQSINLRNSRIAPLQKKPTAGAVLGELNLSKQYSSIRTLQYLGAYNDSKIGEVKLTKESLQQYLEQNPDADSYDGRIMLKHFNLHFSEWFNRLDAKSKQLLTNLFDPSTTLDLEQFTTFKASIEKYSTELEDVFECLNSVLQKYPQTASLKRVFSQLDALRDQLKHVECFSPLCTSVFSAMLDAFNVQLSKPAAETKNSVSSLPAFLALNASNILSDFTDSNVEQLESNGTFKSYLYCLTESVQAYANFLATCLELVARTRTRNKSDMRTLLHLSKAITAILTDYSTPNAIENQTHEHFQTNSLLQQQQQNSTNQQTYRMPRQISDLLNSTLTTLQLNIQSIKLKLRESSSELVTSILAHIQTHFHLNTTSVSFTQSVAHTLELLAKLEEHLKQLFGKQSNQHVHQVVHFIAKCAVGLRDTFNAFANIFNPSAITANNEQTNNQPILLQLDQNSNNNNNNPNQPGENDSINNNNNDKETLVILEQAIRTAKQFQELYDKIIFEMNRINALIKSVKITSPQANVQPVSSILSDAAAAAAAASAGSTASHANSKENRNLHPQQHHLSRNRVNRGTNRSYSSSSQSDHFHQLSLAHPTKKHLLLLNNNNQSTTINQITTTSNQQSPQSQSIFSPRYECTTALSSALPTIKQAAAAGGGEPEEEIPSLQKQSESSQQADMLSLMTEQLQEVTTSAKHTITTATQDFHQPQSLPHHYPQSTRQSILQTTIAQGFALFSTSTNQNINTTATIIPQNEVTGLRTAPPVPSQQQKSTTIHLISRRLKSSNQSTRNQQQQPSITTESSLNPHQYYNNNSQTHNHRGEHLGHQATASGAFDEEANNNNNNNQQNSIVQHSNHNNDINNNILNNPTKHSQLNLQMKFLNNLHREWMHSIQVKSHFNSYRFATSLKHWPPPSTQSPELHSISEQILNILSTDLSLLTKDLQQQPLFKQPQFATALLQQFQQQEHITAAVTTTGTAQDSNPLDRFVKLPEQSTCTPTKSTCINLIKATIEQQEMLLDVSFLESMAQEHTNEPEILNLLTYIASLSIEELLRKNSLLLGEEALTKATNSLVEGDHYSHIASHLPILTNDLSSLLRLIPLTNHPTTKQPASLYNNLPPKFENILQRIQDFVALLYSNNRILPNFAFDLSKHIAVIQSYLIHFEKQEKEENQTTQSNNQSLFSETLMKQSLLSCQMKFQTGITNLKKNTNLSIEVRLKNYLLDKMTAALDCSTSLLSSSDSLDAQPKQIMRFLKRLAEYFVAKNDNVTILIEPFQNQPIYFMQNPHTSSISTTSSLQLSTATPLSTTPPIQSVQQQQTAFLKIFRSTFSKQHGEAEVPLNSLLNQIQLIGSTFNSDGVHVVRGESTGYITLETSNSSVLSTTLPCKRLLLRLTESHSKTVLAETNLVPNKNSILSLPIIAATNCMLQILCADRKHSQEKLILAELKLPLVLQYVDYVKPISEYEQIIETVISEHLSNIEQSNLIENHSPSRFQSSKKLLLLQSTPQLKKHKSTAKKLENNSSVKFHLPNDENNTSSENHDINDNSNLDDPISKSNVKLRRGNNNINNKNSSMKKHPNTSQSGEKNEKAFTFAGETSGDDDDDEELEEWIPEDQPVEGQTQQGLSEISNIVQPTNRVWRKVERNSSVSATQNTLSSKMKVIYEEENSAQKQSAPNLTSESPVKKNSSQLPRSSSAKQQQHYHNSQHKSPINKAINKSLEMESDDNDEPEVPTLFVQRSANKV